ncbi:hypothetical protein DPMN_063782 [Dreissena polymorpha]|uniref:Uncharacterized protein n=1 Tax=Dreissena polymorpha TaxID=45954 RepID=A0A9D4HJG6_DREPO|nr:hypothetical protein DPMN_063782 [Dreissena polymorpha]
MLQFQVQMELRKTWYRLCQRPDPVYIQQRQYLVDANWQRRQINSRNSLNTRSRVSENQPPSSDGSTDTAGCLCKWTLNKNGKLTRTVVNASSLKRNKSKHVQKNNNESRL